MSDSESSGTETTVGVGAPESPEISHEPGSSVGRYLVIEEVGRGGMGVVLRAYDPKLQREVALKSVRTEAMTEAAQARMVQEARAMAKLSHPNVVSVYDVELEPEPGHGVVLAMEYVPGTTLRKWLDESKPAWSEVVEAFIEAGRGLAAAHAAGLLHRDFKPANVLVGGDQLPEGQRVVKVTDFGLALPQETLGSLDRSGSVSGSQDAVSHSGSDSGHERLTEVGTLVGTPAYMAPEQHAGSELGVHADQYAYCVSLWQGLTGELPFPGKGPKLAKAKKKEVPAWPSGSSVPKPIVEAVRRGLSPDPSDRWGSMEELLEAIDYDSGKARRSMTTALGALTAVGVVAVAWAYGRGGSDECAAGTEEIQAVWGDAQKAEAETAVTKTGLDYAPTVWARTSAGLDGYAQSWADMHRESCEATTLRGEQSQAVMKLRMTCLAYSKAELQAAVATLAAADPTVVEHASDLVEGLESIERCADVEALQGEAVESPDPVAVDAAMSELAKARVLTLAGRPAQALEVTSGLKETVERLDHGPLLVRWEIVDGRASQAQGDYLASEEMLGLALEHGLQYGQWEEAKRAAHLLAITVGEHRARPDEAMVYLETAWGLQGRNEADTEGAARLHLTNGEIGRGQGEFEAADKHLRDAIEIWGAAEGGEPTKLATAQRRLASVLAAQGKVEDAQKQVTQARALVAEALGESHPRIGALRLLAGELLFGAGRASEARAEFEAAKGVVSGSHGASHPVVAMADLWLARVEARDSKLDEARQRLQAALAEAPPLFGPSLRNELGNVLRAQGKLDEAQAMHDEALEAWEKNLGEEHPNVADALYGLGHVQRTRGKNDEAQELLERARRIVEKAGSPPRVGHRVEFLLAQVMWDLGEDPGKSRGLAERARTSAAKDAGVPEGLVEEIDAWLAAHPVEGGETPTKPQPAAGAEPAEEAKPAPAGEGQSTDGSKAGDKPEPEEPSDPPAEAPPGEGE